MRLAWFSPMPPVRTGIAVVSAELVRGLRSEYTIDIYTDRTAYDFVWQQRKRPYDLAVYQLGNSSHHDYIWPYLFRYPGLTVLHDAHLHHARAAALLRTRRAADYRVEFAANHPDANVDLAELAIAGFDNHLYYSWPMVRLVVEASKVVAAHAASLVSALRTEHPASRVELIRLAHGEPIAADRVRDARSRVRQQHGIPSDAVVFGIFGGLTPEKRISQIFDALKTVLPYAPSAHVLLAGARPDHFDPRNAAHDRSVEANVTITGYLTDDDLVDHLAACDVSINLRWPTAREMSGPWLRAIAAGLPTITTDLAHLADVPSLDPRTWAIRPGSAIRNPGSVPEIVEAWGSDPASRIPDPVTVAVDILDEDHSLRLAMRRLATDPDLRASLGAAAREYWNREHSMPVMLEDYTRVIAQAVAAPAPRPALPSHLVNDGDSMLRGLLDSFGLDARNVFDRRLTI